MSERNRASILRGGESSRWATQRRGLKPELFRGKKPNTGNIPLNQREIAEVETQVSIHIGGSEGREALIREEGVGMTRYKYTKPSALHRARDFFKI